MTPETAFIIASATVLAAFIAGIVSLTSTVIAKEQKVSEFRQAWIDALREDCSEFLTLNIHATHLVLSKANSEEINSVMLKISKLLNRITLRLNSKDDKDFIDKINKMSAMHDNSNSGNFNKKASLSLIVELTTNSHTILNTEWKRVKRGELLNRFVIASGKMLIGSSLTALFFFILYSNAPRYCPVVG